MWKGSFTKILNVDENSSKERHPKMEKNSLELKKKERMRFQKKRAAAL